MRTAGLSRVWPAAALLALSALALPQPAMSQVSCPPKVPPDPPFEATLKWQDPQQTGPFDSDPSKPPPIAIVLQLCNVSGSDLKTPDGTSKAPYWLRLVVTDAKGGTITSGEHTEIFPLSCSSPSLLAPTQVLPAEVIPSTFEREFSIDDLRQFYPPPPARFPPGQYSVKFVSLFKTGDHILTDCFGAVGKPRLNLDPAPPSNYKGFTVASTNSLAFIICCFKFVGFGAPASAATANANLCNTAPSVKRNFGTTLPLKFQLLDANNAVVSSAVPLISAQPCQNGTPGAPLTVDLGQGSVPTNTFRFDLGGQQYVFNLDTAVLPPGDYQINASPGDGQTYSILLETQ